MYPFQADKSLKGCATLGTALKITYLVTFENLYFLAMKAMALEKVSNPRK